MSNARTSRAGRALLTVSIALAGTASIAGAVALRNHFDTPLMCGLCPNQLTEINVHLRGGAIGLPAYVPSMDVVDADMTFHLTDGDRFSVMDTNGNMETVTFHAADFADIGAATTDEVLTAINGQLSLATAMHNNEHLFLRGTAPGADATLTPADEVGTPLSTLMINSGEKMAGADEIVLAMSVPEFAQPTPGAFDGRAYAVLVSATPGTTTLDGVDVPIAIDAFTRTFLQAARSGLFPSLLGHLDENSDATASIPVAELRTLLGVNPPPKLYFTFVVYSDFGTQIVFAANLFTANLIVN